MFKYSPEAAMASESSGSRTLDVSGGYTLLIKQAYVIVEKSGAECLALDCFEEKREQSITIKTYYKGNSADGGKPLARGIATIEGAILGSLKMRTLDNPIDGKIKKWDNEARKDADVSAKVFPALVGKKIGAVVECFWKESGGKHYLNHDVKCFYEPVGRYTIKEVAEKATEAKAVNAYIALLVPLGPKPADQAFAGQSSSNSFATPSASAGSFGSELSELDSDIPFN